MKKIGILTYHRATNYGAVLQSYSLVNKLKKDFPTCDIDIIDYSTRTAELDHKKEILSNFIHSGLRAAITTSKKNEMFMSFSNSLPITDYRCVSDDIKAVNSYMEKNYDIVISGSDAVFSWNGKKFPTAYLLGEKSNFIKMSYAASAHRLFYNQIPEAERDYCQKAFASYAYLGIRDNETDRFVKSCAPSAVTHHNCDPTFLLDFDSFNIDTSREAIRKKLGVLDNKPLILVMTSDEAIGRIIVEKYSSTHHIVSLFVENKYIPICCKTLSPFEWARSFSVADITVSEYFHATILSLLNGTPAIAIDRLNMSTGYEGKIYDLIYHRLNLPELYINNDELLSEGEEIVIDRVKKVLEMDLHLRISNAIDGEKKYYQSFYNGLQSLL